MTEKRRPGELTDEDRRELKAAIDALPPLTEKQIDELCEVIVNFRNKHHLPIQVEVEHQLNGEPL